MRYQVYDLITREFVGTFYKNRLKAEARVDKLDMIYGGYRYTVKSVKIE